MGVAKVNNITNNSQNKSKKSSFKNKKAPMALYNRNVRQMYYSYWDEDSKSESSLDEDEEQENNKEFYKSFLSEPEYMSTSESSDESEAEMLYDSFMERFKPEQLDQLLNDEKATKIFRKNEGYSDDLLLIYECEKEVAKDSKDM